jgi:transcriptional regulator with XRE-family HTH domain
VSKSDRSERIAANVAEMLKGERIRRQLSMSQVATGAGLSQQMISYVERGMRKPTLDTLLRIAGVLKVDLWKILRSASNRTE